ncbi:MAG: DUF6600 domain-containing protein, partial [Candidatus Acidiferrales bacterium]
AQPGVARVSMIHGDVSTQRGDNGDWVAVTLNTPISNGDRVSTGNGSRAELQLDATNILRLSDNASAKVASLYRNQIQLQVGQGLVTYNVLNGSEASSEIDTPNVAVHPAGAGEYRIQVNSSSETVITIRRGAADVTTPQGSTRVVEGQSITVQGADSPQYQVHNAPARDEWDNWNSDRNKIISNSPSWKHTDRYYTGSEDLDAYGTWSEVPDYGQVWVPQQTAGWAPYRTGRWVYQPYYGWTWVSYEPWGWAPYHYGRWFVYGGNWAWWPGPVAAYPAYYPVWAPAYVSFWGWGGGGFGIGIGFGWGWGNVGWLPIGPCDWYHPWYGRWGRGYRAYGYNNIHSAGFDRNGFGPLTRGGAHPYSNVGRLSTDARLRSGFSSMNGREFGRGAVPGHQTGVNEATLRQASMVSGRVGIQPTRASYSATNRAASASTMRSAPSHFYSAPRNNLARANNVARSNNSAGGSRGGSSNSFTRANSNNATNDRASGRMNDRGAINTANRGSSFGGTRAANTPNPTNQTRATGSFSTPNNATRGSFAPPAGSRANQQSSLSQNRSGWHTFTPPAHTAPSQTYDRGAYSPNGGAARSYSRPSYASRGSSATGNNNYRPPLDLRQPVVTPRGGSQYGSRPAYGSNTPRGNPAGNYRAPAAPSYHAPTPSNRGGGGTSHGGGGGSH